MTFSREKLLISGLDVYATMKLITDASKDREVCSVCAILFNCLVLNYKEQQAKSYGFVRISDKQIFYRKNAFMFGGVALKKHIHC